MPVPHSLAAAAVVRGRRCVCMHVLVCAESERYEGRKRREEKIVGGRICEKDEMDGGVWL